MARGSSVADAARSTPTNLDVAEEIREHRVPMADFDWPIFEHEPLGGNRTWSATFDSYDQYRDDCYYAVRLLDGDRATPAAAFTVKIGMGFAPDINNWTTPDFVSALRATIGKLAAVGETNTTHVAYTLR